MLFFISNNALWKKNIDFVWIRNDRQIMVRTYERGVEGETLACGTGCIASAGAIWDIWIAMVFCMFSEGLKAC